MSDSTAMTAAVTSQEPSASTVPIAVHPATPAATTTSSEGLFARLWHRLMGRRAERLTERAGHMSLLAWLLIIAQSVTMILVIGHTELGAFISGRASGSGANLLDVLTVRVIMGLVLGLLVITVYAADAAVVKTLARIPILRRNRAGGVLLEHYAYAAFVIAVEGMTFSIALVVIEQNPAALFSSASILPNSWLLLGTLVILRALVMCWTYLHLQIVAQPLPVQWETAMTIGRELVGGHAIKLLKHIGLTNDDAGEALAVFGQMSRPPVRKSTWWNGWLVARDEEYAKAVHMQQERVIVALQKLSHGSDEQLAALRREIQTLQATLETERHSFEMTQETHVGERLTRALMYLATRGELPEWLVSAHPELEGFSLPTATGKPRRTAAGRTATREPQSRAEAQRQLLQSLGLEPGQPPQKRKGVWLRPADLRVLTDEGMSAQAITDLLRFKGDGAKIGAGYAAPFDTVMEALYQSHQLGTAAQTWWETSPFSGLNAMSNGEESSEETERDAGAVSVGIAERAAARTGTEGGKVLTYKPR